MLGKLFKRSFVYTGSNRLSYLHGTKNIPFISEHTSEILRKQAKKYTKSPFHVFPDHGVSYTYEEFDQRVDEIGTALNS